MEGSTIKLEEFKEDTFYELYHDGEFKPDTNWETLHDDWIRGPASPSGGTKPFLPSVTKSGTDRTADSCG